MGKETSPLSLPAAALALGTWLAFFLPKVNLGLTVALFAAGLALGRRWGWALAIMALGLAWSWATVVAPSPSPWTPARDRPVALSGRVLYPWQWRGYAWRSRVEVSRLEQGGVVACWRSRISIALEGAHPGELPAPGSLIRAKGYLHRPPGLGDRPPLPAGRWGLSVKSRRLLRVERRAPRLRRAAARMREEISALVGRLRREDGGDGAALAEALILGKRRAVPLAWRRALRRAGLSHLLAISGLHVALVGGLAFFLGGLWGRRPGLVTAAIAVLVYVGLVGPRPSMLRAALMALIAVAALMCERPPVVANALALAVIVLLLTDPPLIVSLSFRLTVVATAGIVHLAPHFAARWSRVRPAGLRRALAVTVAAQLATLPWSLPAFHLLTPLAPLTNLFFVPWTALALAASLATVVAAACWWPLGTLLVHLLDGVALPFAALSRLPPESLLSLGVVCGFLPAAVSSVALTASLLRPRRWLPWCAIGALLVAGWIARPRPACPELVALDVGQGDSFLLRDGEDAVLVDGGGWRGSDFGGRVLLPSLARLGVRRLDAVVLTHPDLDHCGGLADIASYLRIGVLWTIHDWPRSPCWRELQLDEWLEKRWIHAGDILRAGRWRLAVLAPPGDEKRGDNDRSVVIQARAGGHRILLTGDIERGGEAALLRRWPQRVLASEVLKVAHHGSRTSSSAPFLAAVKPRLALISSGRFNPYHHPSASVLRRLARSGTRILRTDRMGMVRLRFASGGRILISLPAEPKAE